MADFISRYRIYIISLIIFILINMLITASLASKKNFYISDYLVSVDINQEYTKASLLAKIKSYNTFFKSTQFSDLLKLDKNKSSYIVSVTSSALDDQLFFAISVNSKSPNIARNILKNIFYAISKKYNSNYDENLKYLISKKSTSLELLKQNKQKFSKSQDGSIELLNYYLLNDINETQKKINEIKEKMMPSSMNPKNISTKKGNANIIKYAFAAGLLSTSIASIILYLIYYFDTKNIKA